jgi:hypothetical protein
VLPVAEPPRAPSTVRDARTVVAAAAIRGEGAAHAPPLVPPEWIAKWRGKFDQGGDRIREQTLARQVQEVIRAAARSIHHRPTGNPGAGRRPLGRS